MKIIDNYSKINMSRNNNFFSRLEYNINDYGSDSDCTGILDLNVYSISKNCITLRDNIISLINNMKQLPMTYTVTELQMINICKGDNKILCIIDEEEPYNPIRYKTYLSLTNNIILLKECLFYISIKYKDIEAIKYCIDNFVTKKNFHNILRICDYCGVGSLKYIIINECHLSLQNLTRKKISSLCKYEDINKLPIPYTLRGNIHLEYLLQELFNKNKEDYEYIVEDSGISYDYKHFIKINNLTKIENVRLKAIGIKEFINHYCYRKKCNKKKINHVLYCEVTSYKYINKKTKYVAITFHDELVYSMNECIYTGRTIIKHKFINKLPDNYKYTFKKPFVFSITAGIFSIIHNSIDNKLFSFSDVGDDDGDDDYIYYCGYYHFNLPLLCRRSVMFIKRFKYYKYRYSYIHKKITVPVLKRKTHRMMYKLNEKKKYITF